MYSLSLSGLEFSVTVFQEVSIRLLDISGRVVEDYATPDSGTSPEDIPLSFPSGKRV